MKTSLLPLCLLAALCFLTACARLTNENLQKVTREMTPEQVEGILGKPSRIDTGGFLGLNATTYHYESAGGSATIQFVNGRVLHTKGSFGK